MVVNMNDSVKIGCYNYKINITDEPIIINNSTNYSGCIDYVNHEIKIKKDMSGDYIKQTLWHEITHGILDYFDIEDTETDHEKIVNVISKGVIMVLNDNKWLMET
jgi:hypothetical protein